MPHSVNCCLDVKGRHLQAPATEGELNPEAHHLTQTQQISGLQQSSKCQAPGKSLSSPAVDQSVMCSPEFDPEATLKLGPTVVCVSAQVEDVGWMTARMRRKLIDNPLGSTDGSM
ncbi:uncharacterized protein LOC144685598 [Cetorhinus maximus]